jgi:hypothetical protein
LTTFVDEVRAELQEQPRGDKVTLPRATVEALLRELEAKRVVLAPARRLVVFAPRRRGDLTHMTRAGVAFENRDGTFTLKLDVLPLDGELHVRAPLGGEVA